MLRTGWRRLRFTGAGIALTAALAFFGPIRADAGLVSGRINDTKGKFQAEGTFRVKDSTGKVVNDRVKTDGRGGYSIFLPPGNYTVEFSDGRSAVIQSHPEPLQQNIYLK